MVGKWFWEPDQKFVNETNTTNLRTINGVRLFVGTFVVWAISHFWTLRQASIATAYNVMEKWLSFNQGAYDSWLLALTAAMGLSIGAYAVKRTTDGTYTEKKAEGQAKVQLAKAEVERAKAPQQVIQADTVGNVQQTGERPAMRSSQMQQAIPEEPTQ